MAAQPTGTVTLVFTDVEGSTRLLERLGPERYRESLELHRRLLRDAFERHRGYEVDYEGDAFFVTFSSAADAIAAASESQQALARAEWPQGLPIRVRIGIHTGEPLPAPPKYVGVDVHKAARIMAAGHGGQVLVSAATERLLAGKTLIALGEHRLKDLSEPEPLYQLQIDGVEQTFPPLKTLGNQPTNLPIVATPFIGRAAELAEVSELLRREDVRLVTLTGSGGIGKTRLALQAAADAVDRFENGVQWVPLASVRVVARVLPSVARALGLREEPDEALVDTLTRYLRDRRLLLVLDNLEQVVGAAPDIANLVAAAPGVRILTTSREALRIAGEHVYDVPALTVPDRTHATEAVAAFDAVQLFAARARATDHTFSLTPQNVGAVVEIVRRLDGLPLAIELAAARVRALPPHALLQRLDSRLRILTSGSRDADERQRTLRAAIQWSHDLLRADEQILLARLAVFVGGCRLDAAETLCDADAILEGVVFDGIASLVDKSLLRRRVDPDGDPRFWMLETIREFALERLDESGDAALVRAKHARWAAEFAHRCDNGIRANEDTAIASLVLEEGNLGAALDFAVDADEDLYRRLVASLATYWIVRGELNEAKRRLPRALANSETDADAAGKIIPALMMVHISRGDLDAARALLDEALRRFDELDQRAQADALHVGGVYHAFNGDRVAAIDLWHRSAVISRKSGDRWLLLQTLNNLGDAALQCGDFGHAQAQFDEVVALATSVGGGLGLIGPVSNLALLDAERGDWEASRRRCRHALSLIQETGCREAGLMTSTLINAARIALARGDDRACYHLIAAVDALLEEFGIRLSDSIERRVLDDLRERLSAAVPDSEHSRLEAETDAASSDDIVAFALELLS